MKTRASTTQKESQCGTPFGNGLLCLLWALNLVHAADPAPGDRSGPALAGNGQVSLVVWQDRRSSGYDICGARLEATGRVLDSLLIASAPGSQTQPAVAWNGSDFLVVWTDFRNGPTADIYGARVSPAGVVLDPQGLPLCTAAMNQSQPAVASDGAGWLVVWQDFRAGQGADIWGTRISGAGAVLDPAGIRLSQGAGSELNPAAAGGPGGYLVVWQDLRGALAYDIYGALVSPAGIPNPAAGLAICTAPGDQLNPAVAASGGSFLVVWQDLRGDSSFDIYGSAVSAGGVVASPGGTVISAAARDQSNPVVAPCGAGYLAAWADFRNGANNLIYGARIQLDGTVADAAGLAICALAGEHYHPAIAGSSSSSWVAWQDYRQGGASDIYGSRLASMGQVLDPSGIPLGRAENFPITPQAPAITWASPAQIVYGTPLGAGQLNAAASAPGTFQYSPPAGTVVAAGDARVLSVVFAPSDPQAYLPATATVTISVKKAPLAIRADDKTKTAGQPNPVLTASCTGFVNGDTATSLAAPVSLTTTATTDSPAGTYPILAAGAASPNYAITFASGSLAVLPSAPRLPVITWASPAQIVYGTPLGAGQLNAAASAPGTFQYSPPAGTVVAAGDARVLSVVFAPSDPQAYLPATATVTISVKKAPLAIRADDKTKTAGQPNPVLTASCTGFVNGDTATSLAAPVSLTTTATTDSPAGTYPILAAGAASPNYAITFASGSLTVSPASPSSLTRVYESTREIAIYDRGTASPYPSTINVAGQAGKISKVTVSLKQLSLDSAKEVGILLVGPAGQKAVLMAGAGGRRETDEVKLTLDDAASQPLPKDTTLRSGTFKPANYAPAISFRAPAPAGPYGSVLQAFNNASPNGAWRLFIINGARHDEGVLAGWRLTITTATP